MFASLGHEVVALHRSQVGGLLLPPDLARGEFRHLTQDELEVVFQGPTTDEVRAVLCVGDPCLSRVAVLGSLG